VQVVPYTECSLGMEPQTYSHSVLAARLFVEKVCTQGKKVNIPLYVSFPFSF
jgi:hypothetical protein